MPVCLLDFVWASHVEAFGDALIGLGCLCSLFLSRSRGENEAFVWQPVYAGFIADGLVTVAGTGGIASSFLPLNLVLLLVGGIGLQSRFSVSQLFVFVVCNLIGWAAASYYFDFPAFVPDQPFVFAVRCLMYIGGIYLFMRELIRAEDRLAKEATAQHEQLIEARESLVHTAKIAEMGNLIATTAHELSQPTQVVTGMATLLARRIESEAPLARDELGRMIHRIQDSAGRITTLLREFRNFSRKESFQKQIFDAREAIQSVHAMTKHDLYTKNVPFAIELPMDRLGVDGDSLRIQQILLNLISNARDAALAATEPMVKLKAERTGRWVRIIVSNTGPCIPLPVQSKLFQTYFTTKEKGRGTGLGLTICAQLVESHGGRLLFSSEDNHTVFIVDLPQAVTVTASAEPPLKSQATV